MAKVLLVDTNFSSRPIYDAIVRLGHEVHVVGGNPADSLAKSSPHYWQLNYADTESLAALVAREGFDYLVPGCTDRSYSSCAIVSQGRFPGIAPVAVDLALNQKDRFRALAKELRLPVPQVQWQDQADDTDRITPDPGLLRWPLVVKPVDGFSGKGITVLTKLDEQGLLTAIGHARSNSARGLCLVEDFARGQLHSHSAFLQGKRVVHDVFVEEYGSASPFVVDTSRLLPDVPAPVRQQLREAVQALARALDLADGLIHTQFMLDGSQPMLIELTRRCPGDLYSQLVELSGIRGYVDCYVRTFLGMPIEAAQDHTYIPILRHTVTVRAAQSFSHLQFHHPVHVARWVPLSLTGDRLAPSPSSRIGILFAKVASVRALERLRDKALARQLYQVVA